MVLGIIYISNHIDYFDDNLLDNVWEQQKNGVCTEEVIMKKNVLFSLYSIVLLLVTLVFIPITTRAADFENDITYYDSDIMTVDEINSYLDDLDKRVDNLKLGGPYSKIIKEAKSSLKDVGASRPAYMKYTNKSFKEPYYEMCSSLGDYVYWGKIKNNRPHGNGVLFTPLSCGALHIGEFKDGHPNGKCVRIDYADKSFNHRALIGEWKDGRLDGKSVTFTSYGLQIDTVNTFLDRFIKNEFSPQNEFIEVAEYSKGKFDGSRKIYKSDKTLLADVVMKKDDLKKGKIYFSNGKLEYDGEFKNGKRHGKGKLYNQSGELIYSGKFKNGDYSS